MAEGVDSSTAIGPAPQLKTLAVFHLSARTGAGLSLVNFLGWLSQTGSVETVVPLAGEPSRDLTELGRVTRLDYGALTLPNGMRGLVRTLRGFVVDVRRFRRLIRDRRPDIVLVATSMMPAAILAAKLERTPTVVYVAELLGERSVGGRRRRIPAALVLRFTQRLSSSMICCSHSVASQFKQMSGPEPRVAYPAIERAPSNGNGGQLRSRYGLEGVDPLIAVVGNISRGRGQDVIVRAMYAVRAHLPQATCVFVGEPHPRRVDLDFQEELVRLAEQLGVSEGIRFLGFLDQIEELYPEIDLVVNPARFEAFGRVACEALLAGRPVVCTRAGGIPEVLRDGVDAVLIGQDDPEALARAIVRVTQDEQLGARMTEAGRVRVLQRYTKNAELTQFKLALDDALESA